MTQYTYKPFGEDGQANSPPGSYVARVVITGFPKLAIMVFSIIVAAYISELRFTTANAIYPSTAICYDNPAAEHSDYRICHNGIAAAVSSILVCMVLLILDLFIPCLDKVFKTLALVFSLLLSIIMAIYLLVTSALLANLYNKYCDYGDYWSYEVIKCGDDEKHFLVLPIFAFLTMAGWGVVGVSSIAQLFFNWML